MLSADLPSAETLPASSTGSKSRMRFFRDARNVSFSVLVGMVLLALRSVLVLEIVGPHAIGVWKSVMALLFASGFVRLGIPQGVALRVSYLRGKGQVAEAERLASNAGSFVGLLGLVLGCGVLTSSFFVHDGEYRLALQFIAGVICLTYVQEFLREVAGARHQFGMRVVETQIDAITNFLATIVLAWCFGLAGLGMAAILTCLMPIYYLSQRLDFRFARKIELSGIRELVRAGLPYSFMEYASHVTRYLGIPIVAYVIGPTAAGYFALSVLTLEFSANIIQIGISRVVAPHLMHDFGRQERHCEVAGYYEIPTKLVGYVSPVLLGLMYLSIPALVPILLPHYSGGVQAAQVTVWAVFFLGCGASVDSFVSAAGKVTRVLKTLALVAPAAIALHYLAAQSIGLIGVAWSCVATMAAVTTVKLCVARKESGESRLQIAVFLGKLYFPVLYSIAIFAVFDVTGLTASYSGLAGILLQALMYVLLCIPVFVVYESRLALVRMTRRAM